MKRKIMGIFLMMCITMSSFMATGCDMLSIFKDEEGDNVTLQDFFVAADNSVAKNEYSMDYTHSTDYYEEENSVPYVTKSYITKNDDGVFIINKDDDKMRTSMWIKTGEGDTTYYSGSIWLNKYSSWDGLGSLTSEQFNGQYGNIGNYITVLDASNMGDLFGKAIPEGEVMVEGTKDYDFEKDGKKGILSISVKDYIIKMNLSSSVSYQKLDIDMEFTFSNGYVNKVVVDYLEDVQKMNGDGTFEHEGGPFTNISREISTYEIQYKFDEEVTRKPLNAMKFHNVSIASLTTGEAYSIDSIHTIKNISGYGSDDGKTYEMHEKISYDINVGYFATGDMNGTAPRYWGHRHNKINDDAYHGWVCDSLAQNPWCDGLGTLTKDEMEDDFGSFGKAIDYMAYAYNGVAAALAYYFEDYDIGKNRELEDDMLGLVVNEDASNQSFTFDFEKLSNNDNKLVIDIDGIIINKDSFTYATQTVPAIFKRSGSVEIIYDDNKIKSIKLFAVEKEVELEGTNYVETGKVRELTSKYDISYSFDETIIDLFPEGYDA